MAKTFMEAVEACAKERTQEGKLEAIKGIKQHHQRLIHEALNKHRRFNVRDWPEPKAYAKEDYPIFVDFYKLLDALAAKRITGNEARYAVSGMLGKFTKKTAGILARVIRKDLDCGAEKSTWLKVYPELDLPDFQVMLARKMPEGGPSQFHWKLPCQADIKYNGYRLIAMCEDGVTKYFSRQGRLADFVNGLFDADMKAIENALGYPVVVDGEVLGEGFQETAEAKGEKNVEHKKRLRFYAFDMMPLSEWIVRSCSKRQAERTYDLGLVLAEVQATKIIPATSRVIKSIKEAEEFYNKVVKTGEKGKNEGLIIKDLNGLYEWLGNRRSGTWTKWKPVYPYDLKIVGWNPGKGAFKGMVGSLMLDGHDENGRHIKADASGMDLKMRKWFTQHLIKDNKALGLIVEVECGEVTKAKKKDWWSLRFPQFKQIRWDKSKVKPF